MTYYLHIDYIVQLVYLLLGYVLKMSSGDSYTNIRYILSHTLLAIVIFFLFKKQEEFETFEEPTNCASIPLTLFPGQIIIIDNEDF